MAFSNNADSRLTAFAEAVVNLENKKVTNSFLAQGSGVEDILLRSVYYSFKDADNEERPNNSVCTVNAERDLFEKTEVNGSANLWSLAGVNNLSAKKCRDRELYPGAVDWFDPMPSHKTKKSFHNDEASKDAMSLRLSKQSSGRAFYDMSHWRIIEDCGNLNVETMPPLESHVKYLRESSVNLIPVANNGNPQAAGQVGCSETSTRFPRTLQKCSSKFGIYSHVRTKNGDVDTRFDIGKPLRRIHSGPQAPSSVYRASSDVEEINMEGKETAYVAGENPRLEKSKAEDIAEIKSYHQHQKYFHPSLVQKTKASEYFLYSKHEPNTALARNGFWTSANATTNQQSTCPSAIFSPLSRSTTHQYGQCQTFNAQTLVPTSERKSEATSAHSTSMPYTKNQADGRVLQSKVYMPYTPYTPFPMKRNNLTCFGAPKQTNSHKDGVPIPEEMALGSTLANTTKRKASQELLEICSTDEKQAAVHKSGKKDSSWQRIRPRDTKDIGICPTTAHNEPNLSRGQFSPEKGKQPRGTTDLSMDNPWRVDVEAIPLRDSSFCADIMHPDHKIIEPLATEVQDCSARGTSPTSIRPLSDFDPIFSPKTIRFQNCCLDKRSKNLGRVCVPRIPKELSKRNDTHESSNQLLTRKGWTNAGATHGQLAANQNSTVQSSAKIDRTQTKALYQQQEISKILRDSTHPRFDFTSFSFCQGDWDSQIFQKEIHDLNESQISESTGNGNLGESRGEQTHRKTNKSQFSSPSSMSFNEQLNEAMFVNNARAVVTPDHNHTARTEEISRKIVKLHRISRINKETVLRNDNPQSENESSPPAENVTDAVYLDSKDYGNAKCQISCGRKQGEAASEVSSPASKKTSFKVDAPPHLNTEILKLKTKGKMFLSKGGPRPFRCQFDGCTRTYRRRSHLMCHQRIHTGEKPFLCLWRGCQMAFRRNDELKRHYRKHTGERPYKCWYCFQTFSRSDHRVVHVRKTHAANTWCALTQDV